MRKERERRTLETAGMLFTLLFGNLLHFVYDWTGQAGWAALSPPSTNPPGST